MSFSRLPRICSLIVISALAASPAAAGAKGSPKAAPQVKAAKGQSVKPVKSTTPKTKSPAAGGSVKPVKAAKAVKPTKADAATKAAKVKGGDVSPSSTPTGGSTAGGSTNGNTWVPDNPVADKLSTKPNLVTKAKAALPEGTNLNAATSGFKNFGQFVAAINVSQNLGIPFADLKAAMTGTTLAGKPTEGPTLSLGQAIQKLKPGVDGSSTAQSATRQADAEIAASPTKTSKTGKSE